MSGLTERDVSFGHDQVDGIEVCVAAEAPCEVGLGVGGRVEFMAERT